ncbi:MAG: nucleotide exchange factor GrpE [Acidimicrobiales bacterium]
MTNPSTTSRQTPPPRRQAVRLDGLARRRRRRPTAVEAPLMPRPESDETADITVEDLVANLEAVTAERDNYLDGLRRLQAEFENYRKAVAKRELEARERANEGLVAELLPVLDACDGAVANGADDVAPVRVSLLEILAKQGLERIEESGTPFDPEQHEAVMHEPSDDDSGPLVSQLLRVGYRWKGRTVRPAMVQVRG